MLEEGINIAWQSFDYPSDEVRLDRPSFAHTLKESNQLRYRKFLIGADPSQHK